MKVAELLEKRQQNWRELERLCVTMESRRRSSLGAESIARFATLYRSACADLALCDAYQLPPETIHYLHQLVGRAHNQLYRSKTFDFSRWVQVVLVDVPRQLFHDNCLRLAFVLFWGVFLASMSLAMHTPGYAEGVLGKDGLAGLEDMYDQEMKGRGANEDAAMFGFYVQHNTSIGLKCFAFGAALLGIGGLFELSFNAFALGAAFGHMATVPQWDNFRNFVTAHGPFELTAIVLSAAAGMRVGFAVVFPRGLRRIDAWRKAARESVPVIVAAGLLFAGAAVIEGFISPSPLPYWFKALVAAVTSGLLMFYFVMLGYPAPGERHAT
jgi:uncharacterized membrane protein SpoIIM required for sporulation